MKSRRARKRRGRNAPTQLRMTSMMDILTVLLLFLLKSFVVEGEVITPASGIELPSSVSKESPEESLVIAIDENRISVGNELVADLSGVQGDDMMIDALADHLIAAREQMEALDERRGREQSSADLVTIQGDRTMPYDVLQKVMFTCNQSGFGQIALAVLKTS